jgi:hypothetical protein
MSTTSEGPRVIFSICDLVKYKEIADNMQSDLNSKFFLFFFSFPQPVPVPIFFLVFLSLLFLSVYIYW